MILRTWADAPAAVAAWVARQRGWRKAAVGFVTGAASLLAMAPMFWTPVLFVTLPVLVWLLDGVDPAPEQLTGRARGRWRAVVSAAAVGWWFGFGYLFFGLLWIGEAFLVEAEKFAVLMPFAVSLLPAALALYFAAACALAWRVSAPGLPRLLALAIALAATEWLRGHLFTGFPWNALGYALTPPPVLLQSASLVGVYALTPWVVLIFASPLVLWAGDPRTPATRRLRMIGIGGPFTALALLAIFGALRLDEASPAPIPGVRLRLVQPSIPQREKWQAEFQRRNFMAHLDLSLTNPSGQRDDLEGITHVIWPEAAMPFQPLRSVEALQAIGQVLNGGAILLAGGLRLEEASAAAAKPRAFNSLMVFAAKGDLIGLYDKIHLVPFGEYLPFQQILESIGLEQLTRVRGGFASGVEPRPLLAVPGLPALGVLICYEAIFPDEVVQGPSRPSVLLNVTNDGWFGETWGPYQHFHQARVRAVEQGLPLIRGANNGISAIIDPMGRVTAELGLNVTGVADGDLPAPLATPPLFARYGGLIAFGQIALLCGAFALVGLGNRHRGT